jgi:hypothetical protein
MNHAENRGHVDQAMQFLPALPTKSANPTGRRRDRERNQQQKSREAHGDVRALRNIVQDLRPVEEAIEREPSGEMEAKIEKREKAQHAAESDQLRQMKDFAKRRDRKSDCKKTQDPIAGGVFDELNGIQREVVLKASPNEDSKRYEAEQKDYNLRPLAREDRVHGGDSSLLEENQ